MICKCEKPQHVVAKDMNNETNWRKDNRKNMKCMCCGAKWVRVEK